MQKLTERGIHLAKAFRELGYNVIESYPGAAQDIMRIPRKKSSLEDLVHGLGDFGIKGTFLKEKTSHDELDAITSAVVGYFYLAGDYEPLGNEREGYLIIPKLHRVLSN
jgi:predicted nuclease with RNAse H fold